MKKVAIIGVGGKTGTMFAFELKEAAEVLGVGKEKEIEIMNQKKVYIDKNGRVELFEGKVIKDTEFKEDFQPDFIFLATKNPVAAPIKFYYQKFKNKEKVPTLLISQNGFSPLEDAKNALKEIFGRNFEKIKIVRIILFNPIQKKEVENKILITYSLPLRIALAPAFAKASAGKKASVPSEINNLIEIFKVANFEVEAFPENEAQNLEFSKLFLNLIGMASASRGLSIRDGLSNPEIFKEEIESLKEYIRVVETAQGKFLNFSRYPVRVWTILINLLPTNLFLIFKPLLVQLINQEREEKTKDLDEIEFYNGAVVKLGKKMGVATSVNEKIYKRVLEKLGK
jgi:ketopantoate reductase